MRSDVRVATQRKRAGVELRLWLRGPASQKLRIASAPNPAATRGDFERGQTWLTTQCRSKRSAQEFPVFRENNRDFRHSSRVLAAETRQRQAFKRKFPKGGSGNFFIDERIENAEQRNRREV
jgi:hypothetical protein